MSKQFASVITEGVWEVGRAEGNPRRIDNEGGDFLTSFVPRGRKFDMIDYSSESQIPLGLLAPPPSQGKTLIGTHTYRNIKNC